MLYNNILFRVYFSTINAFIALNDSTEHDYNLMFCLINIFNHIQYGYRKYLIYTFCKVMPL